ncbi:putative lipoprotein [Campylobacter coli 2548]|nr:putative lipoprotein [Campylobacter coli 2548]
MQLSLFDENNLKDLGIQSIKAYEEKNEKKLKDLIFKINCVLNLDSQKDLVLQIRSIYIEIYKNFLKDEEIKNLTLGFVIKLSLIYDKSVLEELKKINISNNFLQDVLKMDLQNFSKEIKLFVKENLKNQISEVLNLPYGWGGYNFERDCSLLTRDVFSAFGLYLPRNSAAQKNSFTHFDINTLDNSQKKDFLDRFGKAYLNLLYLPGHIMLYAGKISDKNVAVHNIWGLRKDETQRLLISSSVITSLEIGKDEISKENLLLSRLKEVSFIYLSKEEKEQITNYLEKLKNKAD